VIDSKEFYLFTMLDHIVNVIEQLPRNFIGILDLRGRLISSTVNWVFYGAVRQGPTNYGAVGRP